MEAGPKDTVLILELAFNIFVEEVDIIENAPLEAPRELAVRPVDML